MFYNAKFNYRKSPATVRDANGFLVEGQDTPAIEGSFCQVERDGKAHQAIGEDGQQFNYSHTVYAPKQYGSVLEIGDTIEIEFLDGSILTKQIVGLDTTDRKRLIVWL